MYTYVSLDNTPFQHMDVCDLQFMLFWLANANAEIGNVCLSPDMLKMTTDHEDVEFVEQDTTMSIAAQQNPIWGLDRIDQRKRGGGRNALSHTHLQPSSQTHFWSMQAPWPLQPLGQRDWAHMLPAHPWWHRHVPL